MEAIANEANLVKRAQEGEVNAVGELYDRYQPIIFRYVRTRIYDHQLAQDLTGEIFLRMVENLGSYRAMGVPFVAWLYRLAHNHLVNHIRKETAHKIEPLTAAASLSHPDSNPITLVEGKIELQQLLQALERIDEQQREVLILRFLVEMPLQEVADALGKTVAAVKTLQHRGVLALRVAMRWEMGE
ncbi:MAG: sigma-70 family RNA polymerase sigma factor [Anaerolineae bacterium]|nr:sigma-70 family RNA polymerase sigma factor [Anaerolineae bacterium]